MARALSSLVLYCLSKMSAPLPNSRYLVPLSTFRLFRSFSMLYALRLMSSSFSFISLTTWKWSNTSVASGQFSMTDAMNAVDRSVATCFILTPLRLIFFQNPVRASVPLPSPTYNILPLSRSTTMVLYTCPLRTANSSMPIFSTPSREGGL